MSTPDATNDATRRDNVTFEEAARLLGVSLRTVQRRVKDGHLNSIESDGARLVCLATAATNDATRDKPCRDSDTTARQIDATKRDSEPDATSEVLALLKSENAFLRGMLEARERDAAELRAALRKALEAMPKALPDGGKLEQVGTEKLGQVRTETDAANPTTPTPEKEPGQSTPHAAFSRNAANASASRRKVKPWQRAIMRMIGAR
jgi:excisionase family DNA binding protein